MMEDSTEEKSERKKRNWWKIVIIGLALLILIGYVLTTQITIFVVQPIGAVPQGKTLIISRLNTLNFIDSADAWCQRKREGVSLLCRGMALAKISKTATVYLRLPYSETLYLWSTGGKEYSR